MNYYRMFFLIIYFLITGIVGSVQNARDISFGSYKQFFPDWKPRDESFRFP